MATNAQADISQNHFSNTKPVLKDSQISAAGGVPTASYAEAQNIDTLETYLLSNGYNQATLNLMTKNDKIFAYREKKGSTVSV